MFEKLIGGDFMCLHEMRFLSETIYAKTIFEKFFGFVDCIKGDSPLRSPKLILKSLIKTELSKNTY